MGLDQSQSRIHSEAEAVERVLYLVWKGEAEWKASIVLEAEIRRNPHQEERNRRPFHPSARATLRKTGDSSIESGKLVAGDGAMIPLEQMTDEQFEQHALGILHRELGVYGLARFLRVYRSGTGDYTRDRHQWLKGLTVQELAREFEGRQV
jgi:hypothetical protein